MAKRITYAAASIFIADNGADDATLPRRISTSSTWQHRINSRFRAPAGSTARIWQSNQGKRSNIVMDRGQHWGRTHEERVVLGSSSKVKDEEAPFDVGENEAEGSGNEQNFSVRMKCSGNSNNQGCRREQSKEIDGCRNESET
jgi:hypothetical protein